ncbi:MAG: isoprenyl transferase-like protein [Bacilli bacterium]|nr:isoprenyl transferase-like protein [Bacilli bacterium]
MQPNIIEEMIRIVDEHVYVAEFNELLKNCILDKAAEKSIWSEITQYSHYMFGGNSPSIHRLAALTEMMMLSLDIMDDLQDQDNTDKLWMKCPPKYALNAFLALLMGAINEIADIERHEEGSFPLVREVSGFIMRALDGQYSDLNDSVHTEEDYIKMIQQKSGSLIRAACYMGYGVLSLPELTVEKMNELAVCIGTIAQIENDIKDITRFDLKNDMLQKKRTLPIFYLLAEKDEDFSVIQDFYEGKLSQQQFLEKKVECIQYILDSGCIEYSRVIQRLFINQAEQILESLEAISPWKEKFREVTFI